MTQTDAVRSRIARQLTLRRLELTALSTTALAFVLTVILVETGRVYEANPATAALAAQFGWGVAGLLGIGAIAGSFGLFRVVDGGGYSRSALAGGLSLASLSVADFAVNLLRLVQVGTPTSVPESVVVTAAPAIGAGVLLAARPSRSGLEHALGCIRPVLGHAAPAVMAVFMVTSMFAGIVVIGTQPIDDGSGTIQAQTPTNPVYLTGDSDRTEMMTTTVGPDNWSAWTLTQTHNSTQYGTSTNYVTHGDYSGTLSTQDWDSENQ